MLDINTTREAPNGRGCGSRKSGEPYLSLGLAESGELTVYDFVIDPVIIWPSDWIRGTKILDRGDGIKDVVIFVGKAFYASAWAYVEETANFGVSRKVAKNFPFEELTPGVSRMLFAHRFARPTFEGRFNEFTNFSGCKHLGPEGEAPVNGEHYDGSPCAYGLASLAYLHEKEERLEEVEGANLFRVNYPSFSWAEYKPVYPLGHEAEKWEIGIFLALPVSHLEYKDFEDADSANRARSAGFPVVTLDY